MGEVGFSGTSVYAASKEAVCARTLSLTKTLSAELVGRGIRVNAVSPSATATPIYGKLGLPQAAVDGGISKL